MTTKVLLVDPDIDFIVSIRRALESSGDYKVNVFAEGRVALDLLRRESHDVAIVDSSVSDIDLRELVTQIRRAQPWLFVMISARHAADLEHLATLNVQGSITKPYTARQLGPVMQEAAANKKRQGRKTGISPAVMESPIASPTAPVVPVAPAPPPDLPEPPRAEPMARLPSKPPSPSSPPAQAQSGQPAQPAPEKPAEPPSSDMFDRFSDWLSELAAEPDETFTQVTQSVHSSAQIAAALENIAAALDEEAESGEYEPPIPEEATVRDLVSGQPSPVPTSSATTSMMPATPDAPPPTLPEPPVAVTSATAELALEIASDDTIPLEGLAEAIVEKTEFIPPEERPSPAAGARVSETVGLRAIPPEPIAPPEPAAAETSPEPDIAAALALQLTQLSVESAAQITLLTRDGALLKMAGLLPDWAVQDVLAEINRAWAMASASERAPESGQHPALFRYLRLANHTDYLLYSTHTLDDMILTMLFPGDVPLRVIRRQARQLREALENVPEPPAARVEPVEAGGPAAPQDQGAEAKDGEAAEAAGAVPRPEAEAAEAARTLRLPPTDLRPPPGLREGVAAAPPVAQAPAENVSSYTFVLLPRHSLETEQVPLYESWLRAVAQAHEWPVEGLETQPTYLAMQVRIPEGLTPTAAVDILMHESAQRAELPDGEPLWAEPFYVVAPGRPVTQQEIHMFIGLHREAERAAE